MLDGLPRWGKVLALLACVIFAAVSYNLTRENFEARRKGDLSKRKFAEIIVSATLTVVTGALTMYIAWELAA